MELSVQESGMSFGSWCPTGELAAPGGKLSPVLDRPGVVTLYAKWLAEDGTQLATNQVDLVCVSTELAPAKLRVIGNAALANILRDLGYHVSEGEAAGADEDEIVCCPLQ